MKTRLITGSCIVALVVLMFLSRMLTPYIFDVFITLLAIVGCIEIAMAYNNVNKYVNIAIGCTMPIVLFIGSILGILNKRPFAYYLVYILSMLVIYFILVFFVTLFSKDQTREEMLLSRAKYGVAKYSAIKSLRTCSLYLYPSLFFLCFNLINHFLEFKSISSKFDSSANIFITFMLISIFVCTMLTDTFAYVVGSIFKGPKLCPKISPKKTISGAIGGLIFGLIGILALFLIFNTNESFAKFCNQLKNFNAFSIVLLGVLGSLFSQAGDLFESFIKRKTNLKDSGNILPGHGGIMDRMDGIIFNALLTFVFMCVILF